MKKKIIYFALFFLMISFSNEVVSQNTWNGSSVSTSTTNGDVG